MAVLPTDWLFFLNNLAAILIKVVEAMGQVNREKRNKTKSRIVRSHSCLY